MIKHTGSQVHILNIQTTSGMMNSAAYNVVRVLARRSMSTAAKVESVSQTKQSIDLTKFDPNNYYVPFRPGTLNDTMEPYGSWKVAYAAENKRANMMLFRGILCFTGACLCVYYGGVIDGVIMPNLDNIMEDTEPFNFEKGDDRISV